MARYSSVELPRRRNPAQRQARIERITTILLQRQIAFLDRIVVNIRLDHKSTLARSDIIQALIEAAMRGVLDPLRWL